MARMTPATFYSLLGSVFGYSADYGDKFHAGQDYPWGRGTAIPSFARGRVVAKGYTLEAGYYVVLYIDGRFWLFYHMLGPSPLDVGEVVDYGTIVGYVGSTGDSSGYHLHLACSTSAVPGWGTRVDPVPLVAAYLKAQSLKTASTKTTPITDKELEQLMSDGTTRYVWKDEKGTEYQIIGERVPGGWHASTSEADGEAMGVLYGDADGAPLMKLSYAKWQKAQAFAKKLNLAYEAHLKAERVDLAKEIVKAQIAAGLK